MESGSWLTLEKALVLGLTLPCVPTCQYCVWVLSVALALMCAKLASTLSAKPPKPVVRAG